MLVKHLEATIDYEPGWNQHSKVPALRQSLDQSRMIAFKASSVLAEKIRCQLSREPYSEYTEEVTLRTQLANL